MTTTEAGATAVQAFTQRLIGMLNDSALVRAITMWGVQTTLRMLAEAGFTDVEVKPVPGNLTNNYYIARMG